MLFVASPRLSLLHWEERAMGGGDEDEHEEKQDRGRSTLSVNQPCLRPLAAAIRFDLAARRG
jgi:hypothetical protein